YRLDADESGRLMTLLELLVEDPLAPTAIRDPHKAADEHLADALVGVELDPLRHAGALADIGSGAGIPGLPLAIAFPRARVSLIESSRRKCEFIRRAVGACDIGNAEIVNSRAEEWEPGFGTFD